MSSDDKTGKKSKAAGTTATTVARSKRSPRASRQGIKKPSASKSTNPNKTAEAKKTADPATKTIKSLPAKHVAANTTPATPVNQSVIEATVETEPVISYPELRKQIEAEFSADELAVVDLAHKVAEQAHEGQFRQSGLAYITHPLAVAAIAFEMKLDYASIAAALLHDVLEDTPTDKSRLTELFGTEITEIVDGLSKLNKTEFRSREQAQAASLRKMLLAMVSDMRVILIKLADRLHNMRTLGSLAPEKKRRIARETLEVYAPIANRLGINNIKEELEELGFAAMNPRRKTLLEAVINKAEKDNSYAMRQLITRIERSLQDTDIEAQVFGRQKSAYSFYRKNVKRVFNLGKYWIYSLCASSLIR